MWIRFPDENTAIVCKGRQIVDTDSNSNLQRINPAETTRNDIQTEPISVISMQQLQHANMHRAQLSHTNNNKVYMH